MYNEAETAVRQLLLEQSNLDFFYVLYVEWLRCHPLYYAARPTTLCAYPRSPLE